MYKDKKFIKNIFKGLVVQPSDLSYITLISKISELLESKRYKANIEKLSYLVKDSKSTALEVKVCTNDLFQENILLFNEKSIQIILGLLLLQLCNTFSAIITTSR